MQRATARNFPDDGTVVYHVDVDPLEMDPARCEDYIGHILIQAMYEPLLVRNPTTSRFGPGAAARYSVSADRLTYRFVLRDRCWSDGSPVTAFDFVFSFQRLADPRVQSPVGPLLEIIRNGEQVLAGDLPPEELGVTALSANLLEITLENEVNYLEALLSAPNFSPVPESCFRSRHDPWQCRVTNGPFVLSQYRPGEEVRLERNPHSGLDGGVSSLRFWIQKDLHAPLHAYMEGGVHLTCNTYFPFERLQEMRHRQDLVVQPSGVLFLLQLNQEVCPALADVRVRQALSYAVDRQTIARELQGGVLPWNHFVAAGVAGSLFQSAGETQEAFQPERGWQLWRDVWNGEPRDLRILFADFYPNREILCSLKRMWEKTLGITVELEAAAFGDHTRRVNSGEFEVALVLLTPSYSHPSAFLRYFLPDLEEPFAEELVSLLVRAQETMGNASKRALRKADALLQQVLPAIPLCNGQSIFLQRPEIRGYRMFPDGTASFRAMSLDRGRGGL